MKIIIQRKRHKIWRSKREAYHKRAIELLMAAQQAHEQWEKGQPRGDA